MADRANHAIRDGDLPIVYISGDKGLYKFFVDSGQVFMMKAVTPGETGVMAGYAALTRRIVVPLPPTILTELIVGGGEISPTGIWQYTLASGWVLQTNGLPQFDRLQWPRVAVHPTDPNRWLGVVERDHLSVQGSYESTPVKLRFVGGNVSPVWETLDAGATWAPLVVARQALGSNISRITGITYLEGTTNGYAIVGQYTGSYTAPFLWVGDTVLGGMDEWLRTSGESRADGYSITSGQDGEAVFTARSRPGGAPADMQWFGYFSPSGITIVSSDVAYGALTHIKGTRAVVAREGGNIFYTSDYRASAPQLIVGSGSNPVFNGDTTGGYPIAVTIDGTAYTAKGGGGGGVDGIAKIINVAGASSASSVYSTLDVEVVAVGKQFGTKIAAMGFYANGVSNNDANFYIANADGTAWETLVGPGHRHLWMSNFEVIERL